MGRKASPSGCKSEERRQALTESRYTLRPAADRDLDAQAVYYATAATPAIGHRFLVEAHATFSLLATQPDMGWLPRLWRPKLRNLRVFRVRRFERVIVLYLPLPDGIDILRVVHGSRNMQAFVRRAGL